MNLSVTMYSFNTWARQGRIDIQGFIEFCGGLGGLKGVDLLSYYWKDQRTEIPVALRLLKAHNLGIASYAIGTNFAQGDKDAYNQQIASAKKGVDVAVELGAPSVRVFGGELASAEKGDQYHDPKWGVTGTLTEETSWTKVLAMTTDALIQLTEYAEKKKVVLALENHGGIPRTVDEIEEVVRKIDSPYFRLTLDTANFLWAGDDPVSSVRRLARYAAHVHIKDIKETGSTSNDPKERYEMCTVGDGVVDLPGCLRELKTAGYQKFLSIEFEGAGDPREGTRRSLEYLKGQLKAL